MNKIELFFCMLAFFVLVLFFGCIGQNNSGPENLPAEPEVLPFENSNGEQNQTGLLVLSITDREAEIEEYKELNVRISGIEVHKTGSEWIEFSIQKKEFNLFELDGIKALLGEKELPVGKYTGARLKVESVELVEEENGIEEVYSVKVPSEKIMLVGGFELKENDDLELVIDFDPYSVVLESNEYFLKPRLKLLTVEEFEEKVQNAQKEKLERENEKPKILEIVFPQAEVTGGPVEIKWKISSMKDKQVEHTAVHWDLIGGHEENHLLYANASEIMQGTTNENFSSVIELPVVFEESVLFFRIHAIVEGENVYSSEMKITILPEAQTTVNVKEFEVLSDDLKFEPAEVSARAGDLVRIVFSVPTSKVSFGGERIKSDFFDIQKLGPGETHTVEFTMPESSFMVSSFWPSTNIFKASMKVDLETG